jgi:DNA-binding transcriptional LysR family regulator
MELRQLEYFVAVAEEANFTRAASRVHISQSGVSAQIRQLERELGQALFDRSGRSVRLTGVGVAMLPYARDALDAAVNARLAVDQLAGLVRGQVTVGMVSGCSIPVVPELVAGFHDLYPGVGVALAEADSDHLVELLHDGRVDLALIGTSGDPIAGVESVVVADEAVVAAVGAEDPLAARTSVTLGALRDRPLVCLPRGTGVRAALDTACSDAGFAPCVAFEASALAMVAQLAGRGLGVAMLPASAALSHGPALHVLDITRPRIRSRLEIVWDASTPTNPAARVLIDHSRTFLRQWVSDREQAA